MLINFLPLREWRNNHVKIIHESKSKKTIVTSFDEVIITTNEKVTPHILLEYFRNNFDDIQKKYDNLLDKTEKNL